MTSIAFLFHTLANVAVFEFAGNTQRTLKVTWPRVTQSECIVYVQQTSNELYHKNSTREVQIPAYV